MGHESKKKHKNMKKKKKEILRTDKNKAMKQKPDKA